MTAPEGWWKSVSPSGIRRAEDEAHAAGLTCPITAELFRDPVICAGDGYTYEREGVEKWFADGHDTSPMTGATLRTRHLVPNFNVRQRADQMRGGAPVGMTRSNDTAPSEPPPGATHASPSDVRPHEITPAEPTEPSAPPGPAASSKMKPDGGKGGGKGDDSKKGDESDGSPSLLDWVRGYPGVSGGPRRDQLDAYGWFDGNDGWRASRPLHRAAMRGDVDEIVNSLFQPLAIVLMGGVLVSTIVILVTVPILVYWFES